MPSSRGSSQSQNWTCVSWDSCIAGGFFTAEPPGKPQSKVLYTDNSIVHKETAMEYKFTSTNFSAYNLWEAFLK